MELESYLNFFNGWQECAGENLRDTTNFSVCSKSTVGKTHVVCQTSHRSEGYSLKCSSPTCEKRIECLFSTALISGTTIIEKILDHPVFFSFLFILMLGTSKGKFVCTNTVLQLEHEQKTLCVHSLSSGNLP